MTFARFSSPLCSRFTPWVLGAAALLTTARASAHQADDEHYHETKRPRSHPEKYQSKRYGALEFRLGVYRPRVDSEFEGATPYEDAFGDKRPLSFGLEADWQVYQIPFVGSIGPGVGAQWFSRRSTAPFTTPQEGPSAHPDRLWMVPMWAVLVLRVDVLKRQLRIPFVPYIKGGLGMGFWEARDAKEVSTALDPSGNTVKGHGFETGLQLQVGGMIHLNPLLPQMALDMDSSSGVNDAYLFGEWWYSDVDSFDKGMQIGTSTWTFGLAIEF